MLLPFAVELTEGLELGPDLRLVRPLAQGGMASLWVARQESFGREVVVKVLAEQADASGAERFIREARVTSKVQSLHVVRILTESVAARAPGELPYFVMELLRGEDLATRLSRVGRLSMGETRTVVEHVALALEKAHGVGILHRDVKPANVFLTEVRGATVAKLVDFGIARDASEPSVGLTRPGSLMGTPPFMSPEQVAGDRDIDSRCDLWSLAVLAYSCLTGRLPFDGPTFSAVCVAIHLGRFERPSALRPELSARVDAFFARALCRERDLRYRGVRELAEAFRAATWSDSTHATLDPQDDPTMRLPTVRPEDAVAWATTTLLLLDDLDDPSDDPPHDGSTVDNLPIALGRPKSGVRPKSASALDRPSRVRALRPARGRA